MVAMFENFVSVTQEEDVPQVGGRLSYHITPLMSCVMFQCTMFSLFVWSGSVRLVCVRGAVLSALGGEGAL